MEKMLVYEFFVFLSIYIQLNHAEHVDCGTKSIIGNSAKRIVGGEETVAGEWPWMAALFYRPSANEKPYFKCGATLISDKWIATAAHCTKVSPLLTILAPRLKQTESNAFSVRLGEHDLQTTDGFEQDIQIKRVISHPKYGPGIKTHHGTGKDAMYVEHDIALMELATPAKVDKRTSPVCVDSGLIKDFVKDKMCSIIGWGNKKLKSPTEPRLLHTTVPLVSKEKCNCDKSYGGMITENMVCAGFEQGGRDTCEGDSGGPLMCEASGKWYLHGISSFGHDACAIPHKYGVYTKVSQFRNWIRNITNIDC